VNFREVEEDVILFHREIVNFREVEEDVILFHRGIVNFREVEEDVNTHLRFFPRLQLLPQHQCD
jgi:hypothetical protein